MCAQSWWQKLSGFKQKHTATWMKSSVKLKLIFIFAKKPLTTPDQCLILIILGAVTCSILVYISEERRESKHFTCKLYTIYKPVNISFLCSIVFTDVLALKSTILILTKHPCNSIILLELWQLHITVSKVSCSDCLCKEELFMRRDDFCNYAVRAAELISSYTLFGTLNDPIAIISVVFAESLHT